MTCFLGYYSLFGHCQQQGGKLRPVIPDEAVSELSAEALGLLLLERAVQRPDIFWQGVSSWGRVKWHSVKWDYSHIRKRAFYFLIWKKYPCKRDPVRWRKACAVCPSSWANSYCIQECRTVSVTIPVISALVTSRNIPFGVENLRACLLYQQNAFAFLSSLSVNKIHSFTHWKKFWPFFSTGIAQKRLNFETSNVACK